LRRVAETESGLSSLAACLALARLGEDPDGLVSARLGRACTAGSAAERWRAIFEAPLDPELSSRVDAASRAADPETRVLALARMAREGSLPQQRRAELWELSKSGPRHVSLAASRALAELGESGARDALVRQLGAPKAAARTVAALGLWRLGDWYAAALALADDSPVVRRRVACRVLAPASGPDSHRAAPSLLSLVATPAE
jgi:HEAT repeat protein